MLDIKQFPKLDLITGKDSLRPILNYVNITLENTMVSDSHIAIRIGTSELFHKGTMSNVEEFLKLLKTTELMIHGDDFKKFTASGVHNLEFLNGHIPMIKIHGKGRPQIIEVETTASTGKYVNLLSVLPQDESSELSQIAFDPKFIETLSKAMRFKQVKMKFGNGALRPITIEGLKDYPIEDYQCVVMPIKID